MNATEVVPESFDTVIVDIATTMAEADEWDMEPLLMAVYAPDDGTEQFKVTPFRFRQGFWNMAPPPILLGILAKAMTNPEAPPPPIAHLPAPELVGLVFFCEGWALFSLDKDTATEWTESGHQIVDHPAATEVKTWTAVMEDHTTGVMQPRHEELKPAEEGTVIGGEVADGLKALLQGMRERDWDA